LTFGMSAKGLQAYAANQYGVQLTETEAAQARQRFFRTYPGLQRWHRRQPREPVDTRTLAGRRRLGVKRFTEQLNSPVQGSAADGMKAALARLWESREHCPSAVPVLCVHDEIVIECDAGDAETAQAWLVGC